MDNDKNKVSKYRKLARNSLIFALGNILSKSITLLMLPFYTHFLSQAEYGQIDIIITTIALLIPIFTISIVEGVIRFSLDKKNFSYGQVVTNSLVFIILGVILLFVFDPLISKISFINDYKKYFYLIYFIQSVHASVKQFSRSIGMSKIYVLSDILYTSVFVISNIVLIYLFKMGISGYFTSMVLAYLTDLVFLSIKTRIIIYIRVSYIEKEKIQTMLMYCLPLVPNTIMWWVMSISDRYLLVYYIGLGANGLYAVANKFPAIISSLYSIFFKAWQVSAIEEYDSKTKEKFYSNIFHVFFFTMMLFASLYMIFNKLIVSILVSSEFFSAWRFAPILVLGVVFSSFSSFIGTNYVAMKKTRGAFITSLSGAVTNFILNILLIPYFEIYGAAIATLISFITMWLYRVFDTRKFIQLEYPIKKMAISIFIIFVQLMLVYLKIDSIIKIIGNLLMFFTLLFLSKDYLTKPFHEIFIRVKRYLFKKKHN